MGVTGSLLMIFRWYFHYMCIYVLYIFNIYIYYKTLHPYPPKCHGFAGVGVRVALEIPQGYPCHALFLGRAAVGLLYLFVGCCCGS